MVALIDGRRVSAVMVAAPRVPHRSIDSVVSGSAQIRADANQGKIRGRSGPPRMPKSLQPSWSTTVGKLHR
jgi:hypothetical protein